MENARKNFNGIAFDSLSTAATVSALTSSKFAIDKLGIERRVGGKPVDKSRDAFAVRFTRRFVS